MEVVCPFCGGRFPPAQALGVCAPCGGCSPGKNCPLACPRCGYSVFAPSAVPPAAATGEGGALPLGRLPLRQSARVVSLEADESSLRKLLTLGILPGTLLELERRRPCYVCKVGRARLAFDEKLAACIWVVGLPPAAASLAPREDGQAGGENP